MIDEDGTSRNRARFNMLRGATRSRPGYAVVLIAMLALPVAFRLIGTRPLPSVKLWLLEHLSTAYPYAVLLVGSLALVTTAIVARRRQRKPLRVLRYATALTLSACLGIALIEVLASLYLGYLHHHPSLRTIAVKSSSSRSLAAQASDHEGQTGSVARHREPVNLVVVGESSAEGVPYRDWVSVGKIVTWQLRSSIPNRMFHVDIQARAGWTLERMQQRLAELRQAPDVLIVYAGHNEFASRFGWSSQVPYYEDEQDQSLLARAARRIGTASSFRRLVEDTLESERVSMRPARAQRKLVDSPSCSPERSAEILEDFRSRLDEILDFCDRSGTVAVLVIPPGNDSGYEPNRSILPPETPSIERELFTHAFREAAAWEKADPARGKEAYRTLIAWQPGFAESHFRLARLLEYNNEYDAAFVEYTKARDLDGHPMRCTSPFQRVYRDLASRHGAILIDGPAEFHAYHPSGLLNDELLNDGFHPSFAGQTVLATAILRELQTRRVFEWPQSSPMPHIDLAECARHFDVTDATWESVCEFAEGFYEVTARIRFDPAERLRKSKLYQDARNRIASGTLADHVGVAGVGVANASKLERAHHSHIETATPNRKEPGIRSN